MTDWAVIATIISTSAVTWAMLVMLARGLGRLEGRFEQLEKRFDDLRRHMVQRFDDMQRHMEQRFDDMQRQLDQQFNALDHRFDRLEELLRRPAA